VLICKISLKETLANKIVNETALRFCSDSLFRSVYFQGLFLRRRDEEEEASVDREALGSGVADYTFGRLIAKGCHAAVYEASVSQSSGNDITHGMSYITAFFILCLV